MQNKVLVGAIPGYFDPFVDNEVDLVVVDGEQELAPAPSMSAEVHSNKLIGGTTVDFDPCTDINLEPDMDDDQELEAPSVQWKAIGFMTDEGSAFSLVAKRFGWTHILDHRHFATQILSAWHGLSDPKKF
jgi:hypothetical protein